MIRMSINIITFFVTFNQRVFISYVDGNLNIWLEPQIFEFGEPISLNCNVTERTKAVAWWVVGEDRSPKKIYDKPVLNFTSANHSHSATYECFHTFENNGFQKYSRKVLVLETHCSKCICISKNLTNAQPSVIWKFRFNAFRNVDIYFECDGARKDYYNKMIASNGMTLKDMNFLLTDDFTNCSTGFENSKLYPTKCQTTKIINDCECNKSSFPNLELGSRKKMQGATTSSQLVQSEDADETKNTTTINLPVITSLVVPFIIFVPVILFILLSIFVILLSMYGRKRLSKEIYDFREDDDENIHDLPLKGDVSWKEAEYEQTSTDECRATVKKGTFDFLKRIFLLKFKNFPCKCGK